MGDLAPKSEFGYDTNGAPHTLDSAKLAFEQRERMGARYPGPDWEKENGSIKDAKDRVNVKLMTDRQLLEEICTWQRVTGDTLERFMESMGNNPMLKALSGRFGKQ